MVNADSKMPIKAWNDFIWCIVRYFMKAEVYFIQSKCIVIKQIISEKNYSYWH